MTNSLTELSQLLAAAVEKSGQHVVAVHGRPRMASSGILWRPGLIVAANHTITREDEIEALLPDGSTVRARLKARDAATDIALLELDTTLAPAPATPVTDLKPGLLTLSVGRSATNGTTATMGVLSAVGGPWRSWLGGHIEQFLRLDLALYPGASGAAFTDTHGNILGMATSGLSRTSIVALPAVTVNRVLDALLSTGRVSRGYLGVGLQPVALPAELTRKADVPNRHGVIILSVEPGSPAELAPLYVGDILLKLNDKSVEDTDDVLTTLEGLAVGAKMEAVILRGGVRVEASIEIGERPAQS